MTVFAELSYGDEKKTYSTKGHPLGTRGVLPDGRVFRFSLNGGTAREAGLLMQAGVQPFDGEWDMDVAVESTHSAGSPNIGSKDIPLLATGTLTSALLVDHYQDGLMYVNDGPGEGHVYHVSSHPALSSDGGSTVLVVHLGGDDEIVSTALSTLSLVGLIVNEYSLPVPTDIDTTLTRVLGVMPAAVAADQYFWLQTYGPAAVSIADNPAVPVVGRNVVPNISTSDEAGSVVSESTAFTSDANEPDRDVPVIGYAMGVAAAATDKGLIFLTISP